MNTQFKPTTQSKGIDFNTLKQGDVFEYMDEDSDIQHGMKVTASLDGDTDERYNLYVDLDIHMVFDWCDRYKIINVIDAHVCVDEGEE